ncbi:hypothetical protein [Sulfitobacter aestuariivivens]|uniref:hypothetical protein n=1 Tax=Sulfitobacter aestuariivivens TaxID=2766981 RepID=UPI00361FA410
MFRLIFRQRRRLLFTSLTAALSLLLLVWTTHPLEMASFFTVPWIGIATFSIVFFVLVLSAMAIGVLVLLVLPTWRQLLEVLAIFLFVIAVTKSLIPQMYDIAYVGGVLPFFLYIGIFSLMYGTTLDRFPIWLDHHQRRHFVSPLWAQALWDRLVPLPETADRHWDPLLHEITPDPEARDTYDVRYAMGGSLYELQTITYLDLSAPHHARYHHVGEVDPKNRALVEGTYEVTITPARMGTAAMC